MFCAIPNMAHTSLMNFDMNRGSLSLITHEGSPKCKKTWLTYKRAISSVVISSQHRMKTAALVQSWSVTVRTESYPFDQGSLVMKSSAMVSNGIASGFGRMGTSGALVGRVFTLFRYQSAQPH